MEKMTEGQLIQQRANSKQGEKKWHCCQFASYAIYGDKLKLNGAKNWLSFGSSTTDATTAKVIVATDGSHVGVVIDGGNSVIHAPGANSVNPIKKYPFANFVKYVMPNYVLRK